MLRRLALLAGFCLAATLGACDGGGPFESSLQADVLDAARAGSLDLAAADVAFFVTDAVAASGRLTAEGIARAVAAAVEAEEAAFAGSVSTSLARAARASAFETWRAARATPADAVTAERRAFELAYAAGYQAAGESARDQAFAAQARARALDRALRDEPPGDALELTRQARLGAALATARALRRAFAEADAPPNRLADIEAAAQTWEADVRAGRSLADFDRAHVRYNGFPDGLHTPLVLVSGVSSPGLTAAEIATLGARRELGQAVAAATDGWAVGHAVRAYYTEARAILRTTAAGASPLAVDGVLLTSASAGVRDGS